MVDPRRHRLEAGVAQLELQLLPEQLGQLIDYLSLLMQWNRTYNLTAIRDPQLMVVKHLLDSLAVVPQVQGDHIIDVGTGAGLPGVPLAIAYPERRWTLLDSNGKKTRFLFQVKTQLGLSNIEIVEARAEHYQPAEPFSAVISRAFASLATMVDQCSHLVSDGGTLYAMKSAGAEQEIEALDRRVSVGATIMLNVPFLDEIRSLVTLKVERRTDLA